jgi:GntR family transcriptional regulator
MSFRFRLDPRSGVPAYRQIIDQVMIGVASNQLAPGDQLPTVRQLAVDLAVTPNTIARAYKEMELRGLIDTQQGLGSFISQKKVPGRQAERQRQLDQMVGDLLARAGAAGFTVEEVMERLNEFGRER